MSLGAFVGLELEARHEPVQCHLFKLQAPLPAQTLLQLTDDSKNTSVAYMKVTEECRRALWQKGCFSSGLALYDCMQVYKHRNNADTGSRPCWALISIMVQNADIGRRPSWGAIGTIIGKSLISKARWGLHGTMLGIIM
eukprot:1161554-Pelagomonas_calceolata.AAC.4